MEEFRTPKETAEYLHKFGRLLRNKRDDIVSMYRKAMRGSSYDDMDEHSDDPDFIINIVSDAATSLFFIRVIAEHLEKELKEMMTGFNIEKVCIKEDPLGILEKGKIYAFTKFKGEYIMKNSDVSIGEETLNTYFKDLDV